MSRMTNVEAVTEVMEFSRYGTLAQAFVMDALAKHSRAVADADPAALASMEGGLASRPPGRVWLGKSPRSWNGT